MGIIFNLGHAILRQTLTQIQFRREEADPEIVWNHIIERMTKETKDVVLERDYNFLKIFEGISFKNTVTITSGVEESQQ